MKLPTLYRLTSADNLQEWTIKVSGDNLYTFWGRVGGKIQEGHDKIPSGKNIGRVNETTAAEQSEFEAKAHWEFKKKEGYIESKEEALAGKVDSIIEGGIFPMLAHKHAPKSKYLQYPCYVQPKLDGHRCIAIYKDGKVTLWSRSRKAIKSVPHIVADLETMGKIQYIEHGNFIMDGELYNHDYHDNFEDLTHFIRQQVPIEGHEIVQYHIYDMPSVKGGFAQRHITLKQFFHNWDKNSPLQFVETMVVYKEEELMAAHKRGVEHSYEGVMARNGEGSYKQDGRSYDLLKVKRMLDAEFKCVGVREGRGKLIGHAIFDVDIGQEEPCKVKMAGETSELKKYLKDPSLAIGKMMTVQFQGYTKSKSLRFPVGLRFQQTL